MIKYEVNKPFPFPHPMPGAEISLTDITTGFFDIKAYFVEPAPEEIKDWRKGKATIAVYEHDKCPFIILKFDSWSIDASINILKVRSDEQRDIWLNNEGNVINLFLIDSRTNVLKAIRTVSVSFSEGVRDILEEQANRYATSEQVERRIAEIQHGISTDEMFARAKFKMKIGE